MKMLRRSRRSVSLLGAAVALASAAGCAHYEPQPVATAETARAFSQRSLSSPQLAKDLQPLLKEAPATWPPAEWDRGHLLAVALVQNPELGVMRANLAVTVAQQQRARELPNPDMTLQSEYSRGEQYTWLYGVGFDFLLASTKQRRLGLDMARRATSTAGLQLVEKTWQVRRELLDALSDWELARRRAPILQQLLDAQHHLLEIQRRRIEAGEDPPSEAAVAELASLQVERALAEAREKQNIAQSNVAAALGLPPDALDSIQFTWSDWGAPPTVNEAELPGLREQALLGRADLAESINDYADSEDRLQLAIARQYPQFHLSPGYYWDHGVGKWPVNLGLALPLFNHNQGEIAEARANRELAGQRMLAVQAKIYGEIAVALRSDQLTLASAEKSKQQMRFASEQSKHAELALDAGGIDSSERVSAEIVALQTVLDELDARASRQAARNSLENALRLPLSGPERALGSALQGKL